MYRFEISIVCLVVFLFTCRSYAGETSLPNPYAISYPFKNAIIYYNMKNEYGHGKVSEGTEVVYIKGDNFAKITKVATPDSNEEAKMKDTETLRIFTPDYIYVVDLIEKTAEKMDNSKKYTKPAYDRLSDEEKNAFHKRMERRDIVSLDLLGLGKKVGTDTILGRECDVYLSGDEMSSEELLRALESGEESFYVKSWIWKQAQIPLKVITAGAGWSNELIATKAEENVKIPENTFTVPSDIEITYDKEKSEFAKREALARFELYKTGKPMVVKMKLKKEKMERKANSGTSKATRKSPGTKIE